MCLVEPDRLARLRVAGNGLAAMASPQPLRSHPLEFDVCLAAVMLYLLSVLCMKDFLPGQVNVRAIVANIEDLFARELFGDGSIYPREDLAAVGNRRFASLIGLL